MNTDLQQLAQDAWYDVMRQSLRDKQIAAIRAALEKAVKATRKQCDKEWREVVDSYLHAQQPKAELDSSRVDEWRVQEAAGVFLLLDSCGEVITSTLPKSVAIEIANRHNIAPNPLMDEIERLTQVLKAKAEPSFNLETLEGRKAAWQWLNDTFRAEKAPKAEPWTVQRLGVSAQAHILADGKRVHRTEIPMMQAFQIADAHNAAIGVKP